MASKLILNADDNLVSALLTSVLADEGIKLDDPFAIDTELATFTKWVDERGATLNGAAALSAAMKHWVKTQRGMPARVGDVTLHVKVVRNYGPVTIEYGETQTWAISSSAEYWRAIERMTDALWAMHAQWLNDKAPGARFGGDSSVSPAAANQSSDKPLLATSLEHDFEGGKHKFSVKCGEFQKFGVAIYPEALKASGFDADTLQLGSTDLTGYVAHVEYHADSGKPRKVVKLAKAQ